MIDSCCRTLIFHSRVCQKMICTVSLQRDQGTLDFPCLSFIYFLSSRMLPAPWRGIGVGYIYPRLTAQKAQQWDKASEQRSCEKKKMICLWEDVSNIHSDVPHSSRCSSFPHCCVMQASSRGETRTDLSATTMTWNTNLPTYNTVSTH